MSNVIKTATNKFTKGLVMDFSPENTSNEVLTHALNATLLTFNGNEMSLQNDMGNGRVETAFLPEGYMPVGTCEYGGIIYIVSYNPLEDKSQIGCFPSPERNISNEELGISNQYIASKNFQGGIEANNVFTPDGTLKNTSHKVILRNDKLNPGDKFIITSPESIYENQLADLYKNDELKSNPIVRLNVVSIEDSGRIVYLNNNIKQYENEKNNDKYKYYILGKDKSGDNWDQSKIDIDAYRDVLNSGYSVFKSKTSGKLAILAELIMVDTYSVTHSLQQPDATTPNKFDIIIHTEASSEFSNDYDIAPKLKYYYLKESQGYVHDLTRTDGDTKTPLFTESRTINPDFKKLELKEIFNYEYDGKLIEDENNNPFNFPIKDTYYGNDVSGNGTFEFLCDNNLKYPDVKLGTITLPEEPFNNSESFPFKYDYTIVPCMEYGRLDHLAVSNTIDFTHLHDFAQSKFNIWKYHIDGNQVTLTFGAEIYDTMQDNKVDALIVEFYDLWGFAGSFEISGKRSYSGVFTKILNLNAINALNKKRIIYDDSDNTYKYSDQDYSRNIAIEKKSDGNFYLNNNLVKFIPNKGWVYDDNTDDKLLNELSDCGALYSNIIYGVKTYLRQTDSNNTQIFTPKQEFFLYTLPIFNDYYYIHDNFSILQPELELVLTYKLKENGTKQPYTSSDGKISNGWNDTDNDIITKYLGGTTNEFIINAKQYYQFKGITNLYLEIGLKEEYNNYYLRYIKNSLNEKFSCDLQLTNNDATEIFSVKSDIESNNLDTLLNYNSGDIDHKNNYIILSKSSIPELNTYNFTEGEQQSINIDYNFIVGYDINITDIIETEVPTTTVCALCHKNGETYNYEDFGVYVTDDNKYFCTNIFFNRGNTTELEVGLARQISSDGTMNDILAKHTSIITEPKSDPAGKLNTHFLSEAVKYIGKLTFAQPHAHALIYGTTPKECDGVNLYKPDPNLEYIYTNDDPPQEYINNHNFHLTPGNNGGNKDKQDNLYGTFGLNEYTYSPQFNLSLNTKNSLLYYGEFISTINYNVSVGGYTYDIDEGKDYSDRPEGKIPKSDTYLWAVEYNELSASQLEQYNKALITTMKSVYAYNPDYDSYKTKVGNVIVQNKNTQIITNLISTNANLNVTTDDPFINYICFGSMRISDYLEYLKTHSGIEIINKSDSKLYPNLNIQPNLKYCGKDSYLISQITYNIPKPTEIENQLTFNTNNQIMVKHEDGSVNFINGTLNKRTLYGYNQTYKKLIELNVNNYSIKQDGQLELNNILIPKTTTKEIKNFNINCESEDSQIIYSNDDLNIKLTSTATGGTHKFLKFSDNNLYLYVQPESNNMTLELKFECSTKLGTVRPRVSSSISAIGVELTKRLDGVDNNYTTDEYNILHQPIETLKQILVTHSSRANTTNVNVNLYKNDIPKLYNLQNGFIGAQNLFPINNPSSTDGEFKCPIKISSVNSALIEISIKSIILYFTHYESIYESTSDSIISIPNKVTNTGSFITSGQKQSGETGTRYKINDAYKNNRIRYTNFTLNDLVYDPSTENGHRLFIRDDCYLNSEWFRNQIFYRGYLDATKYTTNNKMYLMIGPSFDKN